MDNVNYVCRFRRFEADNAVRKFIYSLSDEVRKAISDECTIENFLDKNYSTEDTQKAYIDELKIAERFMFELFNQDEAEAARIKVTKDIIKEHDLVRFVFSEEARNEVLEELEYTVDDIEEDDDKKEEFYERLFEKNDEDGDFIYLTEVLCYREISDMLDEDDVFYIIKEYKNGLACELK